MLPKSTAVRLNQRLQTTRQLQLSIPGHTILSNTNSHSVPTSAQCSCAKQSAPIQTLLRSGFCQNKDCEHLYYWSSFSLRSIKYLDTAQKTPDLGTLPFSISVDASDYNKVKLFQRVVKIFSAKVVVKASLLDLQSMPNETSEQMMSFIFSSIVE